MTTILVGTDLSDNALQAADWAFGLARTLADDGESPEVIVSHVVGEDDLQLRSVIGDHSRRRERTELEEELREWLGDVETGDLKYRVNVRIGHPARSLVEAVEDFEADWLVVGQSGRGRLARIVLGSTAEHLALKPPCPLVVVPPDGFQWNDPLRMLSAVDLSASSIRSLGLGADLVRRHGGNLHVLHVISMPQGTIPSVEGLDGLPDGLDDHIDETRRWARDELDALLASRSIRIDDLSPEIEIRPGYPIHEALDAVDETDANMLTLGSHGRSRFAEFMLGGVGRSLLKKSPCSVVVSPPDGDRRPATTDELS